MKKRKLTLWLSLLPVLALVLASMACGLITPTGQANQPSFTTPVVIEQQAPQVNFSPALPAPVLDEQQLLATLYTLASPAVVNITTFERQNELVLPSGQGSGFVFDSLGHIITNAHVVQAAESLEVTFSNGLVRTAEIIGEDLNSDLAVIRVDLPAGIQPLTLGNMEDVIVGQTVIAIGNPFGLDGTMTRGIVSALGRTIPALNTFSIPQAIQTDAPINPGNSGGPLLNLHGEVIGINAQIETSNGVRANSGVGFAIPISIVQRVVPELIAKGQYDWAWLGVRGGSLTPTLAAANELQVEQGAYLSEVITNGPAAKAGLIGSSGQSTYNDRPVEIGGDVIIAIDGSPVKSFDDLLIYIALNSGPDVEVKLTVLRHGKQIEVPVTLEKRPSSLQ